MLTFSVLAMILVALFAILSMVVLLAPDHFLTAHRTVICPENRQSAEVTIAIGDRIRSLLRGRENLHLEACSRRQNRQECGEECLLQVDLHPQILPRVLRAWAEGKACAICGRVLTEADWLHGRFAGLDENDRFVPGGEMPLRALPMALERYRPICWPCHGIQRERRLPTLFPGSRPPEELWMGE